MDIYSTILTSIKKNDTTAQSVIGSIQSASRGAPADAASHVLSPPPSAERKRASTPTRGIVGITTIDSSALIPTTNVTTTTTTTTTTTAATTYVRQSPPRNLPKPTVEAVTSGSPLPKLARKRARTSSNSVPNSPPPAANISKPDTLAPASEAAVAAASSSALPAPSQRASRRSAEKAAKKAAKKARKSGSAAVNAGAAGMGDVADDDDEDDEDFDLTDEEGDDDDEYEDTDDSDGFSILQGVSKKEMKELLEDKRLFEQGLWPTDFNLEKYFMGAGSQVPGPDAYDSEVGDEYAILTIPQAAPSASALSLSEEQGGGESHDPKRRSVAFSLPLIADGSNQPLPPTIRSGRGGGRRKAGSSAAAVPLQVSSSAASSLSLSSGLPQQGLRMVPVPGKPGEFTLEGWTSSSGGPMIVKVEQNEQGQPILKEEMKLSSSSSLPLTFPPPPPPPSSSASTHRDLSLRSVQRLNKAASADSSRSMMDEAAGSVQQIDGDGGKLWAILRHQQYLLEKIYSSLSVSRAKESKQRIAANVNRGDMPLDEEREIEVDENDDGEGFVLFDPLTTSIALSSLRSNSMTFVQKQGVKTESLRRVLSIVDAVPELQKEDKLQSTNLLKKKKKKRSREGVLSQSDGGSLPAQFFTVDFVEQVKRSQQLVSAVLPSDSLPLTSNILLSKLLTAKLLRIILPKMESVAHTYDESVAQRSSRGVAPESASSSSSFTPLTLDVDFARANAVSEASRVASCLRLAASGVRIRAVFNGAIVHPSVSDENGGQEEQEGKEEAEEDGKTETVRSLVPLLDVSKPLVHPTLSSVLRCSPFSLTIHDSTNSGKGGGASATSSGKLRKLLPASSASTSFSTTSSSSSSTFYPSISKAMEVLHPIPAPLSKGQLPTSPGSFLFFSRAEYDTLCMQLQQQMLVSLRALVRASAALIALNSREDDKSPLIEAERAALTDVVQRVQSMIFQLITFRHTATMLRAKETRGDSASSTDATFLHLPSMCPVPPTSLRNGRITRAGLELATAAYTAYGPWALASFASSPTQPLSVFQSALLLDGAVGKILSLIAMWQELKAERLEKTRQSSLSSSSSQSKSSSVTPEIALLVSRYLGSSMSATTDSLENDDLLSGDVTERNEGGITASSEQPQSSLFSAIFSKLRLPSMFSSKQPTESSATISPSFSEPPTFSVDSFPFEEALLAEINAMAEYCKVNDPVLEPILAQPSSPSSLSTSSSTSVDTSSSLPSSSTNLFQWSPFLSSSSIKSPGSLTTASSTASSSSAVSTTTVHLLPLKKHPQYSSCADTDNALLFLGIRRFGSSSEGIRNIAASLMPHFSQNISYLENLVEEADEESLRMLGQEEEDEDEEEEENLVLENQGRYKTSQLVREAKFFFVRHLLLDFSQVERRLLLDAVRVYGFKYRFISSAILPHRSANTLKLLHDYYLHTEMGMTSSSSSSSAPKHWEVGGKQWDRFMSSHCQSAKLFPSLNIRRGTGAYTGEQRAIGTSRKLSLNSDVLVKELLGHPLGEDESSQPLHSTSLSAQCSSSSSLSSLRVKKMKPKSKQSIKRKSVAFEFESPKKEERRSNTTTAETLSSQSPVHVGSSSAPPKGIINAGRGSSAWSPTRSTWPGVQRGDVTTQDQLPEVGGLSSSVHGGTTVGTLDDGMAGKRRRGGGGGGGGAKANVSSRAYSSLVPVESSFSSEGLMSLLAKADKGIGELLAAAESEENSRSNL